MIDLEMISTMHLWVDKEGLCPVCGSSMRQGKSVKEDEQIFTWFECTKEGCDGQWLHKKHIVKETMLILK